MDTEPSDSLDDDGIEFTGRTDDARISDPAVLAGFEVGGADGRQNARPRSESGQNEE